MHAFVRGLVLAILVGALAALTGPSFALESLWPLFIAAAVAFVPGTALAGRLGAFATGVAAGWIAFFLRAGVLPDVPLGRALFLAVPLLLVAAVAGVSRDRLPLWSGLAGFGMFGAAYHPVFAASPSDFLSQSIATMTTVLLAAGIGGVAAMLLRPGGPPSRAEDDAAVDAPVHGGEVTA